MEDYGKWFTHLWNKHHGLITPTQAARICGLKGGAASVMPQFKKMKIEIHCFEVENNFFSFLPFFLLFYPHSNSFELSILESRDPPKGGL